MAPFCFNDDLTAQIGSTRFPCAVIVPAPSTPPVPRGLRWRGRGAGLTISRRIVERHGGQMWDRSAPDQGTTFYFTV
ncbi:MAG: ATP-binding protein [Streptosporangiaceae bacterium]